MGQTGNNDESGQGRFFRLLRGQQNGIATLELAFILPLCIIMLLAVIDFGRLVQARLIVTNVAREGGDLASRDIDSGADLLNLLKSSAAPIDLDANGRIYISQIAAGTLQSPNPWISSQDVGGSLAVGSGIGQNVPGLGVSQTLYNHLVFDSNQQAADIERISVVEVYYKYRPVTPLPNFIAGLLLKDGDGIIIGSRAVF